MTFTYLPKDCVQTGIWMAENLFVCNYVIWRRTKAEAQDEISRIRKLKHSGNTGDRCGNPAANTCFR